MYTWYMLCIHSYVYINIYVNWSICICIMNTNPYTNPVPTVLSKGASLLLLILLCACQWPSILPLSGNQFQIFFTYCKVQGMNFHVFCHLHVVWSSSTIMHLFFILPRNLPRNWSNFSLIRNKCVYFYAFCHLVWSIPVIFDHFQSQLSMYFITKKPRKTCT